MPPHKIMIVTDAWHPQVNGVVRTLATVVDRLRDRGHVVQVVGPDRFASLPCPTYPSIRLAIFPSRRLAALLDDFAPDALHIATEGPLGIAAARLAAARGLRFTTAYHTRFPEYLAARRIAPASLAYRWMRRFHARSAGLFVATKSLRQELQERGFANIVLWSRGVDLDRFRPAPAPGPAPASAAPRVPGTPVFLYVGRVAVEKNIAAFLDLDLPGRKRVVGEGPLLAPLRARYPDVEFAGALHGQALADAYAGADVFVFPSRTDTFGLVLLEALASGTPVAAYPVTGPRDVLEDAEGNIGALDQDLRAACLAALGADRKACRRHAARFGWDACAAAFAAGLVPALPAAPACLAPAFSAFPPAS